jgi:hypothetical protein
MPKRYEIDLALKQHVSVDVPDDMSDADLERLLRDGEGVRLLQDYGHGLMIDWEWTPVSMDKVREAPRALLRVNDARRKLTDEEVEWCEGHGKVAFVTRDELYAMLDPETLRTNRPILEAWLNRGDGCAVYENKALDSGLLGHKQFVSYGSPAAQLEVGEDMPPMRLPDIGGRINWAYQLVAVHRRCCERDDDGDGNCHIHERRGVLRGET